MTKSLPSGLYEALITDALALRLEDTSSGLTANVRGLHQAEVADRLALHLSRVIERALASVSDRDRVSVGVRLARSLVERIDEMIDNADSSGERPAVSGKFLSAILGRQPDGSAADIEEPLIPLLDTTLLTNAPGEPRVGSQLLTEVGSADRIDVVMAFIRRSGIRPLVDALRRHCDRRGEGSTLRILTTTYTRSTEREALELLSELGADIRVSYDTSTTRLHAKAWMFHRHSGYSTAYIGSSNLTHSAQVSGLEWNVRVSGARNPDVIRKMNSIFDTYWEGGDFRPYDAGEFDQETERAGDTGPTVLLSPIELRLEPFQERLLEQIALARRHGRHHNLLVAATGTGKTVMAAVDYARLRKELPRSRLLFIAHRQEILDQSMATFRYALREAAFGEKWVAGIRPHRFEHVFASIQSLTATGLIHLAADHFDVVIVDEFHHAAAESYRAMLDHIRPSELLGLTATPERSDGLPILHWFDDRIAAELRLWDAIDQHQLAPFIYWGIHDGLDLRDIPWRRGQGYDVSGLTNLYTADDAWARRVVQELSARVDDPSSMHGLGFCVSVEHARFMSRHFNASGIRSVAVWGDSPDSERRAALRDLADGRIQMLFSVDLFNEGVNLPAVDTLLLLRPTDSPTLFLQQLGRGLRRAKDKTACVVLDFVGHHRKEFRFDRRLRALLGGTRKDIYRQVQQGFPFLPAGCHMELDAVASDVVLRNIRESIPNRWHEKAAELRALDTAGRPVDLASFLLESGMELSDVYTGGHGWSDLLDSAGFVTEAAGTHEATLRRAIGRLLHIDDEERVDFYGELVATKDCPRVDAFTERQRRLVRMLVASLGERVFTRTDTLATALDLLWTHPQIRAELRELFAVLHEGIDHVHEAISSHPNVPLQIHGRYSRIDILAAFGVGDVARVSPWQSGVLWAKKETSDLLAFTLDKSSSSFSPTTRYRDYATSRELIHWESQSVTRADSETGMRYRHHAAMGSSIMLFARPNTAERAFWFLGRATYVSHESERPMAITWRLHEPLPGDLYASFAAAVA